MSHELRDNQLRRKEIIAQIPDVGFTVYEMMSLIMDWGYNQRGADAKLRELTYLKMIVERKGRIYRK